jgi:hypothetical protein
MGGCSRKSNPSRYLGKKGVSLIKSWQRGWWAPFLCGFSFTALKNSGRRGIKEEEKG